MHFPATAEISLTSNELVNVRLTNSSIDRLIEISSGQQAEACFSSDAKKIQIGSNNFTVNNGLDPWGAVYKWKSYATAKETKSVCFVLHITLEHPAEKDQGFDDIEAILTTFRWLNP